MRSGRSLATSVVVLLFAGLVARAADFGPSTTDPAPWHIAKVTKLNSARPGVAAATDSDTQKYLHIEVNFNVPPDAQKKHKFRVVNERGEEVGDLWGWNDKKSLVIFEGKWDSLMGLYLDANGHREPLFRTAAPLPIARYTPPITPTITPRTYYEPDRDVVVREPVYYPDRVVVRRPAVVDDRDVVVANRHGGNNNVVVADTRPAATVVSGGSTSVNVVVHGGGGGGGSGGSSGPSTNVSVDTGSGSGSGSGPGTNVDVERRLGFRERLGLGIWFGVWLGRHECRCEHRRWLGTRFGRWFGARFGRLP